MPETKMCPKCGAELPVNAPAGICPTCLMQAGIASLQNAGSGPQIKPNTSASSFVPPTPEELGPQFPQLEILELLGKGGMGAVYKARQPRLDRLVALKILPPEISHDPSFAERFQREARALAKLSHPHIVAVYDFGQTDELCYIVMEFVDGANLRHASQSGGLSPAEALAIVPQICEALQFAHDEGVVHRDIKPENILIDKRGRVKIADFGLAKLLGQDASDHSLTATLQVMGTLRYMAPEQMQGSREVDHRADIYSLGVVFYELLTGELPMGKFAPPSKKVQIDVRLDEVVLRALEADPEQRYQQASDVKTDMETIRTTVAPTLQPNELENPSSLPRFSRFAIAGAVWAILGLMAMIPMLYSIGLNRVWNGEALPTGVIHPEPPEGFMGGLLALAVNHSIGTTILGVLALRHIKQSKGKLLGLRLAQSDALFFPLLVLGAAAFLVGFVLLRGPLRGSPPFSSGLDERFYQSPLQEIVALFIALPIWFFPARALWRVVVGPRDAFAIGRIPLVGDEPLTDKAALVLALAAVASHAWPWHWVIMPPPASRSLTISNFDDMSALLSLWLLVLSIGLALFASATSLARPAKLVLRIGTVCAAIAALVIQVQFSRSLGEFEPGQVEKVVRLTRTYSHMGVYVTMALTGLAILFFLLRIFDEPSQPQTTGQNKRPIGLE